VIGRLRSCVGGRWGWLMGHWSGLGSRLNSCDWRVGDRVHRRCSNCWRTMAGFMMAEFTMSLMMKLMMMEISVRDASRRHVFAAEDLAALSADFNVELNVNARRRSVLAPIDDRLANGQVLLGVALVAEAFDDDGGGKAQRGIVATIHTQRVGVVPVKPTSGDLGDNVRPGFDGVVAVVPMALDMKVRPAVEHSNAERLVSGPVEFLFELSDDLISAVLNDEGGHHAPLRVDGQEQVAVHVANAGLLGH